MHREERDFADNFPSLLVVNSFAGAKTVKEKDKQRVTKDVIRNAIKNHVLIVRTLDLERLADQLELCNIDSQIITKLITTETGWLKVDQGGKYSIVRA